MRKSSFYQSEQKRWEEKREVKKSVCVKKGSESKVNLVGSSKLTTEISSFIEWVNVFQWASKRCVSNSKTKPKKKKQQRNNKRKENFDDRFHHMLKAKGFYNFDTSTFDFGYWWQIWRPFNLTSNQYSFCQTH